MSVRHSETLDTAHTLIVVWTEDGDQSVEYIYRSDRHDEDELQRNVYYDEDGDVTGEVVRLSEVPVDVRTEIRQRSGHHD